MPMRPLRQWSSIETLDGVAVLILIAFAVIAGATFRDYGLGWDDFTHSQYGDLLLALYRSGFTDRRALSFVNLYEYGGGFDMAAALAAKVLPFELFETRRLVGAIVGLIGLAITWRLARRIAGPVAGVVALVLLAACPLFYGHVFMNPKDAPFAVAMAGLLLGLVRAFDEYPRPSAPTVLIFGLALGLTVGSRVIGGMAALYALPAAALLILGERRELGWRGALERFGWFLLRLVPGFLLGYLVMALVWPWAVVSPLNPLRAALYFSHFFEKPWRELFDGSLIPVIDMPRSYVPTLFALKMPEVMIAFSVTGIAIALRMATTGSVRLSQRANLLLLVTAATLPILFTVATRPAMYNGIRHFVFVAPPLAVLGGLAGAWLHQRLAHSGRLAAGACAIVAAILVGLPVIEMVRLHPYQYTYFNYLIAGVPGAQHRYMLDYWGLSFKQDASAFLASLAAKGEQPPAGRHWKVAVCGPHPPAAVALGPQFDLTWDPKGADFAMMLGVFYCATLDAPILTEIRREGVLYARVYDIRGRSVSSLLPFATPK
jgi:hypothetical protein